MSKSSSVAVLPLIFVAGCAISQKVQPVNFVPQEMCIVDNPKVMATFGQALAEDVTAKGIKVTVLGSDDKDENCPAKMIYSANWTWDLAYYMRRAEIIVFQGADIVGRALYDSSAGGMRLDKFIQAEIKVQELVDQLFPVGPTVGATNEAETLAR